MHACQEVMWHTSREYSIRPHVLPMQMYDIRRMISGIIFPHANVLLVVNFYFLYHSSFSLFSSFNGLEFFYCSLWRYASYYNEIQQNYFFLVIKKPLNTLTSLTTHTATILRHNPTFLNTYKVKNVSLFLQLYFPVM